MSHQEAPSYPVWSGLKNSVNAKGLPPLGNDFERVQGVVDREKGKKLIDTLCHLRSGNNRGWGAGASRQCTLVVVAIFELLYGINQLKWFLPIESGAGPLPMFWGPSHPAPRAVDASTKRQPMS